MDKLKMHSPDLSQDNISKIRALFPNCVTEVKGQGKDGSANLKLAIDFDQLKQELSDSIVEGPQERYHLNWPGKREALLTANSPIAKTLRPCREESVNFDKTENLFIEGDNLEALKLLQETYLGKVKMIYIDPPYNTGNDFIYKDDFSESSDSFLVKSNQTDELMNQLTANQESNGRFHSDWLSMIYPRIKLAYNLLCDDGYIVVSIDDAEISNIIALMDEIFGKENQIAVLVWDKNRKNDAKFFSVGHEYMLVYSKNKSLLKDNKVVLREPKQGIDEAREFFSKLMTKHNKELEPVQQEWRKYFNQLPKDHPHKKIGRFSKVSTNGPFRDDGNISWPGGSGPKYEVIHPITKKPCKVPDGGWRYSKPERFWQEVDAGKVVFGEDEKTLPRQCRYLFESEGQVMTSVHFSYAQTSAMEFEKLMGAKVFENPKNYKDISRLVKYLNVKENEVVLDFFGGSGTTADAVLDANASDDKNRKFIIIQIPEKTPENSVARKNGFDTISDLSKERIRKSAKKLTESSPNSSFVDIGFRVLKIDTSNMADVFYRPDQINQTDMFAQVENIKEDRTDEDLLFQVLLDWGVGLTLPISKQQLSSKDVFFVNADENGEGADLIACFGQDISNKLIKTLAEKQPLRVVFRDDGFANDSVKINVEQIFKQISPMTDVKSI
jgi:adenine-specific DNA-methyltransferase